MKRTLHGYARRLRRVSAAQRGGLGAGRPRHADRHRQGSVRRRDPESAGHGHQPRDQRRHRVTTNDEGTYLALNLLPGEYLVQVEADRLPALRADGVRSRLGARSRLDISLAVGSIGETVTVAGVTPLLSTEIGGPRHRRRQQRSAEAAAGDPQLGRPAGDGARRAERPLHRAGRRHVGGPHRRRQRPRQSQPAEQLPARRRRQQQLLDQRAGADDADLAAVGGRDRRSSRSSRARTPPNTAGRRAPRSSSTPSRAPTRSAAPPTTSSATTGSTRSTTSPRRPTSRSRPTSRTSSAATLGGPIVRNRVFFFGDYEGTRIEQGVLRTGRVLTRRRAQRRLHQRHPRSADRAAVRRTTRFRRTASIRSRRRSRRCCRCRTPPAATTSSTSRTSRTSPIATSARVDLPARQRHPVRPLHLQRSLPLRAGLVRRRPRRHVDVGLGPELPEVARARSAAGPRCSARAS